MVELSEAVVRWFTEQRQVTRQQPEAGGQLFGRIEHHVWRIETCTGPRSSDRRASHRYSPQPDVENREILAMYERGLHFLGDWHTHPQKIPKPSRQDIVTTQHCYREAATELCGFLLIVVGQTFPYHPCNMNLITANQVCGFSPTRIR